MIEGRPVAVLLIPTCAQFIIMVVLGKHRQRTEVLMAGISAFMLLMCFSADFGVSSSPSKVQSRIWSNANLFQQCGRTSIRISSEILWTDSDDSNSYTNTTVDDVTNTTVGDVNGDGADLVQFPTSVTSGSDLSSRRGPHRFRRLRAGGAARQLSSSPAGSGPRLACCGGKAVYDTRTHTCCNGADVEQGGPTVGCCGTTAYDKTRYFCRDGKVHGFHIDTCERGRTVIVHLFNWKWTDIANECERFLGPNKFCGVQVSPPNEHREIITDRVSRPWWERYQPVSYKLVSRSGNASQFVDMVKRCNAVQVRIFVDAVINHMAKYREGSGHGPAGSYYDTARMEFPGVPYTTEDFNCCQCGRCGTTSCSIENYLDSAQVRNCRLESLLDLDLGREYVRSRIVEYLNNLIEIGVAGFRVDAVKHMWPGDLEVIYRRLKNLNPAAGFTPGTRPFIFNEVIDLGSEPIASSTYVHLGRVTEFRYGRDVGRAFRRQIDFNEFKALIDGSMLPSDRALTFVDNHDNQRGHGAGGQDILTFYDGPVYRAAVAFTLALPYGLVRIMSSYRWHGGPHRNDWLGPPHEDDANWTISDVQLDPASDQCLNDWVCEHRWPSIVRMVHWRNAALGLPVRHWWTGSGARQVAFSRPGAAFIAINWDTASTLNERLQTGLAAGRYCDVISGETVSKRSGTMGCSGRAVTVDDDGWARISVEPAGLNPKGYDPIIAIHVGSKLRPAVQQQTPIASTTDSPIADRVGSTASQNGFQRTAVLIHYASRFGEYVFIRGGIGHEQRPGCTSDARTSRCAIDIRAAAESALNGTSSDERRRHYAAFEAWSSWDTRLDWYGPETVQSAAAAAEPAQGSYNGRRAAGSPTVWTTNYPTNSAAYHSMNRYGDHHWLWEVEMNCSQTESGWFEFKAYVLDLNIENDRTPSSRVGWEPDITQEKECGGSEQILRQRPYASANHVARCGHVNVFSFGAGDCIIESF